MKSDRTCVDAQRAWVEKNKCFECVYRKVDEKRQKDWYASCQSPECCPIVKEANVTKKERSLRRLAKVVKRLHATSTDKIRELVALIKNDIDEIKWVAERPEGCLVKAISKKVKRQIEKRREIITIFKTELTKRDEAIKESVGEEMARSFDHAIPKISKLELSIKAMAGSYKERRRITIGRYIVLEKNDKERKLLALSRDEFFNELRSLYLGEWRRYYDPCQYGKLYLDGVDWCLCVEWVNGQKEFWIGDNLYPYNFQELLRLMEIETSLVK